MKIRVAVIGLGKMGLMHASIMGMFKDVDLVALCEKSSLVRKFGSKAMPHIRITPDIAELKNLKLDAVVITTPPATHYHIIKSICENNITRNVLTEKPLAGDYQQAEELCKLAGSSLDVNMVGYHRRFSVTFRKAKKLLETNRLGSLRSFNAHAYSADFLGARSPKAAIGRGGILEDSGCHIIDMLDWLLGEIRVMKARTVSIIDEASVDEANLAVRTASNIQGEIDMSWCKEGFRLPGMAITITGETGELVANEDFIRLNAGGESRTWHKHDLDDFAPFSIGGNEYQREDALFLEAVRGHAKAEPDFVTASRVELVIAQANEYTRGMKTV